MSAVIDRAARAAACPWRVRFDGRYWWIEARGESGWSWMRQTIDGCRYGYVALRDEWLQRKGK